MYSALETSYKPSILRRGQETNGIRGFSNKLNEKSDHPNCFIGSTDMVQCMSRVQLPPSSGTNCEHTCVCMCACQNMVNDTIRINCCDMYILHNLNAIFYDLYIDTFLLCLRSKAFKLWLHDPYTEFLSWDYPQSSYGDTYLSANTGPLYFCFKAQKTHASNYGGPRGRRRQWGRYANPVLSFDMLIMVLTDAGWWITILHISKTSWCVITTLYKPTHGLLLLFSPQ